VPVVVNEFEVVAEPGQPAAHAGAARAEPAPPPPDVERILAERRAREQRVRAY
jgi:hypothetical protein